MLKHSIAYACLAHLAHLLWWLIHERETSLSPRSPCTELSPGALAHFHVIVLLEKDVNFEEERQSGAESKLKGESRSIRMEDFLSWGQFFT